MSFESSDAHDVPDFPIYPEEPACDGFDSADGYADPGIVNEQPDLPGEAVEYAADADEPLPLPEIPELLPWGVKQIHYIGDTVIHGDHPDEKTRQFLEGLQAEHVEGRERFMERLAATTDRSSEYEGLITGCRQTLANDFGEETAVAPIVVLDHEDFTSVVGVPHAGGAVKFGHIIISLIPGARETYGPNHIAHDLLHEGAHKSGIGSNDCIITAQSPRTQAVPSQQAEHVLDSYMRGIGSNMLLLSTPAYDAPHRMAISELFWEEGFVQEYAVRRRGSYIEVPEVRSSLVKDYSKFDPKLGKIGFTHPSAGRPNYDQREDVIYLPWEYTNALKRMPDDANVKFSVGPTCAAAYAVRLLDNQLPGLFEQMIASRNEPSFVPLIRDRINTVKPGLFEDVASQQFGNVSAFRGLIKVERALGILTSPVEGR